MLKSALAFALSLVVVLSGRAALAACSQDSDCGMGQKCQAGDCAAPDASAAPATTGHGQIVQGFPCKETAECVEGLICWESKCAPENVTAGAPVTAARGGIITGGVFDLIGFTFILLGGALSSMIGTGTFDLLMGAAATMAVGSVIGTAAYSSRTSAYRDAGFTVDPPSGLSWTLTVFTVLCAGGAFGTAIGGVSGDEINWGLLFASIGLAGGATILEIINAMSVRGGSWDKALAVAKKTGSATSSITLTPIAYGLSLPDTQQKFAVVGIVGRF